MVPFVMLQGMDADPIVPQEVVTDPDDGDRMHVELPRRIFY